MSSNFCFKLVKIVGLLFIELIVFICAIMLKNTMLKIIFNIVFLIIIIFIIKVYFSIFDPHIKLKHNRIRKKKISKKFMQIYNYVKAEYGKGLENYRKKIIRVIIITLIILIIVAFLDFQYINLLMEINSQSSLELLLFTFLIPLMYFEIQYSRYNKKYVKKYKEEIIKNFIEYINPHLEYEKYAEKGLMKSYLDAGFTDVRFKNFQADDYICGYNQDNKKIEISNIVLGDVTEKKNATLKNVEPKFNEIYYEGIFSITELNYNLQKEIRILKNKKKSKIKNKKIELDNMQFEKYFDVYSNSEIIAVSLLGHAIMEQMIIFYEEFKIDFEIIIKNNKIYMRFNTGMMFEPNIFKKSYNMKTLWLYYNILVFVTELTVKLNELAKDLNLQS